MFLLRFKEIGIEFTEVKELFVVHNRMEANMLASELQEDIQATIEKCKEKNIPGCVRIPELDIFIISVNNTFAVDFIELKRFEPVEDLTFEHLLA